MKRVLGAALSLLALSALAACSSGDADGGDTGADPGGAEAVRALEDAVTTAREGVARDIAAALEVDLLGGKRRFGLCGESWAPRGVTVEDHLRLGPSPLDTAAAVEAVTSVLVEHGWTVAPAGDPAVVTGSHDDVEVRTQVGPAAVQVDVGNPDCVETDEDVAREHADRASEDVTWEAP